jgi:2-amino-4-ketopentanoate thiolase alpha subunit
MEVGKMSKEVKSNSWVQIHQVILKEGERAPHVPADTKKVPLELRVNGFLLNDGFLGEDVEIKTHTGRILKGELIDADPSYEHKFGRAVPEILEIGKGLKSILREGGE